MARVIGTVAMSVAAIAVATVGCSKDAPSPSTERAREPSPPAEAARPSVPTDAVLVGVVHEDGQHVCFGEQQETWINKFRQIGFVRAVAGAEVDAQLVEAMGKPVVAHGRVTDRIPAGTERPPGEPADCPQYQMRSDWVVTASGMRIRRSPSPALAAFEVARIEPLTGLSARVEGDALRVELVNRLGVALAAPVEVVVHYEGCYGKPGTDARSHAAERGLAPGETVVLEVPLITEADRVPGNPKGTRAHRAYSVEVRASGEGVYFDLDVPVGSLGADVSCPEQ